MSPRSPQPHETVDPVGVWRFLDAELALSCDAPGVLGLAAALYGRFKPAPAAPAPHRRVMCRAWSTSASPAGEPVVYVDGRGVAVPASPYWEGQVCDLAVDATLARVRSHLLFHAASVCRRDQGVLIAGDAHQGKTTLTTALVRRGWRFLGDDIAALGRSDGALHPFAKSLRFWPDTLEQSGMGHLAAATPFYAGKHLVDIEQVYPGSLGAPAPLRHLLVLTAPECAAPRDADGVQRHLDVLPERHDDALAAEIAALASVRALEQVAYHRHVLLRLHTTHRHRACQEVVALCRERGAALLYAGEPLGDPPDFAGPARLEPLSARVATLALLRRVRVLPPDKQADAPIAAPRLFVEIADLLRGVQCWALHVGPLAAMADLVDALISAGSAQNGG